MRLLRPRLRAPAQMAVLGAVAAVVFGLAHGWGPAVGVMVPFLALAAGYSRGAGRTPTWARSSGAAPMSGRRACR